MTKTTLYIGLFDKDSKKQEIATDTANNLCMSWAARLFDGATISQAYGVYTHEDGTPVIEPSIRVELTDANPESVSKFIQTMKNALNQESILKETTQSVVEFC